METGIVKSISNNQTPCTYRPCGSVNPIHGGRALYENFQQRDRSMQHSGTSNRLALPRTRTGQNVKKHSSRNYGPQLNKVPLQTPLDGDNTIYKTQEDKSRSYTPSTRRVKAALHGLQPVKVTGNQVPGSKAAEPKGTPPKSRGRYVAQGVVIQKVAPSRTFRRKTTSAVRKTTNQQDPEDESNREAGNIRSFQINDAETVKLYLWDKFNDLQQQACKRIAKAWIRGICPKKQSKFPYQRKTHSEEGDELKEFQDPPPWWPATELCVYREPDHIIARDRMNLLIHLLRLRPSPEELREWNGNAEEFPHTHAFQVPGMWTAFLEEITPLSLFDDIGGEAPSKVERRPQLLEQIFEVAKREEDFQDGGNDGIDTITWTTTKRARSFNKKSSKRVRERSIAVEEEFSNSSNLSAEEPQAKAKKLKTTTRERKSVVKPKTTRRKPVAANRSKAISTLSTAAEKVPAQDASALFPMFYQTAASESVDVKPNMYADMSLNSSFDSTASAYGGFDDAWCAPSPFFRDHYFGGNEVNQFQHPIGVNAVYGVAQPQFEHNPSMPIISPMDHATGADTYGPMYTPRGIPGTGPEFYSDPYSNFRPYSLYDSRWALNEHQPGNIDQMYSTNMNAGINVPKEHDDDNRPSLRHPYGGLPEQAFLYAPIGYAPSASSPPGVHNGFISHNNGTDSGAPT